MSVASNHFAVPRILQPNLRLRLACDGRCAVYSRVYILNEQKKRSFCIGLVYRFVFYFELWNVSVRRFMTCLYIFNWISWTIWLSTNNGHWQWPLTVRCGLAHLGQNWASWIARWRLELTFLCCSNHSLATCNPDTVSCKSIRVLGFWLSLAQSTVLQPYGVMTLAPTEKQFLDERKCDHDFSDDVASWKKIGDVLMTDSESQPRC